MLECGREGGALVEMRAVLGIGISAWETLLTDSEEFREAKADAVALSEIWWHKVGRAQATGAPGNASVWIFNMKNRWGWRDQVQIDNTSSDGSMTPSRPVTIQVVGVDPEDMEAGNE